MHSFELAYQPKFQHGRVISCEALLRPQNCNNVEEFVRHHPNPIALDKMVISRVLSDIKTHNVGVKIAVNVSAKSLINHKFIAFCLGNVPGDTVSLELTEYGNEFEDALLYKHIEILQRHKIEISLDDFGSGNAHSILLASSQFNEIKIDRSYSQNITNNPRRYRHLELVTNLIKSMGPCDIVYEGIETKEQYNLVKKINTNAIFQGYFLQKPISMKYFIKQYLT